MKLTHDQLVNIKAFIRKRGLSSVDLQLEILDHMACRMEEKLAEDPEKGFDKNFTEMQSEFEYWRFNELENSFRNSLRSRYSSLRKQTRLSWFRFPKVAYTLLAGAFFYLVFDAFDAFTAGVFMTMVSLLFSLIIISRFWVANKKYRNTLTMRSASYIFLPILVVQFWILSHQHIGSNLLWATAYVTLALFTLCELHCFYITQEYARQSCEDLEKIYGPLV